MFKFNFQVDEIEKKFTFADEQVFTEKEKILSCNESIDWYDSEKVLPTKEIVEHLDVCKLNSIEKIVDDIHITHMVSGFLLEDIKDNDNSDLDIKKAEDQHSDLIPGVYEGGAKIWECTDDLLKYLSQNVKADRWDKAQVLDLGCGSGLLGIYAFLKGARVIFQDYNKDVLEKITIPNVLLNTGNSTGSDDEEITYDLKKLEENAQFYSGDWSKLAKLTQNEKFDIVLTSETIYNPQNQQKLLNCLYEKLKPKAVALVAAKSYYFGVGGGLRHFEQLIEKDERFEYNTVWLSTEGVNREIIELIKKT